MNVFIDSKEQGLKNKDPVLISNVLIPNPSPNSNTNIETLLGDNINARFVESKDTHVDIEISNDAITDKVRVSTPDYEGALINIFKSEVEGKNKWMLTHITHLE